MMRSARDRLLRRMRGLHAATLLGALTLARADCEDYDNNCAVCVTETSWGLDCDFCWSDGTCRAVHTNCAREVAHDGSCTVTCSAGQFNVGGSCQQCQGVLLIMCRVCLVGGREAVEPGHVEPEHGRRRWLAGCWREVSHIEEPLVFVCRLLLLPGRSLSGSPVTAAAPAPSSCR